MNQVIPASPTSADRDYHSAGDPHGRSAGTANVILGGQDGLVNVLGVVLGVAGATHDTRIVLAAGLAATIAESLSMAAVAYTSKLAEADRYASERAREFRHIHRVPVLEAEEVRSIYRQKGFTGELLDRIVETITADHEVWVAVMMSEEHGLAPMTHGKAVLASVVVGITSVVGSLIPLLPFALLPVGQGIIAAVALSTIVLFVLGAWSGHATIGRWIWRGAQMAALGIASALIAYAVGLALKVPGT